MTRNFLTLLASLFIALPVVAAPQFLAIEGQLFEDAAGTIPVDSASVAFTIKVISPAPTECVLYEEAHTINMLNSQGFFSLQLGSGTQSGGDYEDVNTLSDAFNNSLGLVSPTNCVAGPTYTPAIADGRQLEITYDSGSGAQTLTQNIQVGSTAYALSAGSIDGLSSSDLLIADTSGTNILDQSNLVWLFQSTRYSELQALINGTSSQYLTSAPGGDVSMNNQKIVDVATPTLATDAANKSYTDNNIAGQGVDSATLSTLSAGDTGEVLTWNGTQWTSSAPAGDSTKLPLAGGTMTGAIDMGTNNIVNINNVSATSVGTSSVAIYNGATYMGFQVAAGGADLLWTLPNADGSANQALVTDGAGSLSWHSFVESASNQGAGGVGPFIQNTVGDLEFKNINAGSNKVTVIDDAGNDEIDIDVDESNFDPTEIPNTAAGDIAATNVQAAIDELDSEKVSNAGDAMTGALTMNAQNEVRFADADSSNYVGFAAPTVVGSDLVWTLPGTDGANTNILATDGAGNLYWTAAGTGEVNTASNSGAGGVGLILAKAGSDLPFKSINAGSSKVTVINDGANSEVDIDVDETFFDATMIPNTAAGNISATNIQAAIDELDTEKAASADVMLRSGTQAMTANMDLGNNRIINMVDPTGAQDAATKSYVDSGLAAVAVDQLQDADTNTMIQVEEGANDDTIRFDTAGTERMVINSTGNVGINIATPSSPLHVNGDIQIGNSLVGCAGLNAGAIRYNGGAVEFCNGSAWNSLAEAAAVGDFYSSGSMPMTGPLQLMSDTDPTTPELTFSGDTNTGLFQPAIDEIGFSNGGIESMRLAANGNLGLGVAAPNAALDIRRLGATRIAMHSASDTVSNFPMLRGLRSRGTFGAPTALQQGDPILALVAGGYDSVSWTDNAAKISIVSTENWGSSAHGSAIAFSTTPAGTGAPVDTFYHEPNFTEFMGQWGTDTTLSVSAENGVPRIEGFNRGNASPIGANQEIMTIDAFGADSAGANKAHGGVIQFRSMNSGGAWSGSHHGSEIHFMINNQNETTPTSGMRLVGTNTGYPALEVDGPIKLANTGAIDGSGCTSMEYGQIVTTSSTELLICDQSSSQWKEVGSDHVDPPLVDPGTTIDYEQSKSAGITGDCGTYNFWNLEDGGEYTFYVAGTSGSTCTFNFYSDAGGTGLTARLENGASYNMNPAQSRLWKFVRFGNEVLIMPKDF